MTTTRGVGQSGASPGPGTAAPAVGSGNVAAGAPGVVGGVSAIGGVSRAVLWVPPVSGAGLNGATESPLQNLRVGQQVTARVLVTDAAAGRALLMMDGQRVAAEVPDGLHEGQVVNLAVANVSTERLVLRLTEGGAPARAPTAPLDAAAVLRALDLPDTAATRAVVTALVERGQPLTRDTIVALRAVVARESGQEIQNARGAVDALLRGVPVTLRSAVLARAASPGPAATPMGDLLQELMAAIDATPRGPSRTPVGSTGALQASVANAVAIVDEGAVPIEADAPAPDARGALARLLGTMVARDPSATELRRVVSILHGAPEARIAQAILGADAAANPDASATADPDGVPTGTAPAGAGASPPGGTPPGSGAAGPPVGVVATTIGGQAVGTGTVAIPGAAVPGGVFGGGTGAGGVSISGVAVTGMAVPDLSTAVARASAAGLAAGSAGIALVGDGASPSVPGVSNPASVVAGSVAFALAASEVSGGSPAWVSAGPDARSFLGAVLALFGATSRPGAVPSPAPLAATAGANPRAIPGANPEVVPGVPATIDRDVAARAAILARVIHDRLEYQQLGNAAVLARGGWEAPGTAGAPGTGTGTPAGTNPGARPEASAAAFPANVSVPPPGDALAFSIPLAFAGQMATLELAVWRDGHRRQDAQEESSPGLHARMRLDLAQLGRVGADIRILGTNLRCRLVADREETNDLLRSSGEALLDRLRAAGFTVEGLDYRALPGTAWTAGTAEAPSVIRRVDTGA